MTDHSTSGEGERSAPDAASAGGLSDGRGVDAVPTDMLIGGSEPPTMAATDIANAQAEVRFAYRSASIGQIYSGLVWLASALAWTVADATTGVVVLLAGGFFIYPVTTILSRALGNPGVVLAANPLREASITIPAVGVLGIPVAAAVGLVDIGWFYPAFMVVMGAHYLPFSHLYAMRVFIPLGGAMWIMGLGFALWAPEHSVLGAHMTGLALVAVGVRAARQYVAEFGDGPTSDGAPTDRPASKSRVRASHTGPLAPPSSPPSKNTFNPVGLWRRLRTETLAMRSHPHLRFFSHAVVLALAVLTLAASIALASSHETLVSVTDEGQRILGENELRDVSDDGRYVLFASDSATVGTSTPDEFESYLYSRDRLAGTTRLVVPANALSLAGISDDGSTVVLSTEDALTPADTNGLEDVYVVRTGQSPQFVSARGGVVQSTGSASDVVISGDGSVVAFTGYAGADLIAGDTPGFIRRNGMIATLGTGEITRVPFPPVGAGEEVGSVRPIELSTDGSHVLVTAFVTGLDELGRPTLRDVLYLWNRSADRVTVLDDAPYDLTVVTRVVEFSSSGERIHVVTSGPARSLTQTITVDTIETDTGDVVVRRSFEAPESLIVDPDAMTPIPSRWRASVSADGDRIALYQAPFGTTVWVHDLTSDESIAQAGGFSPSIGLFEFSLTGDGTALVFERAATDVAGVVDVFWSDIGPSVFSDTGASIFRGDILWLFDQGITKGCTTAGTEFCPDDPVTRGQMAAFLSRALDLPAGDLDRFTDDDGSIFESNIQALAAAGITRGCNSEATLFCPDEPVTRGQMAALLRRALDDSIHVP